jgi:hypothetical protein
MAKVLGQSGRYVSHQQVAGDDPAVLNRFQWFHKCIQFLGVHLANYLH